MARGWESKSVEDQIADLEAGRRTAGGREMTAGERARHQRKMLLLTARARIADDLARATDARYREMLQRSLADVTAEIEALE